MKKTLYFVLILVLVAGASMFGAWSPSPVEETETIYTDAQLVATLASETVSYKSRTVTSSTTLGGAPTYVAVSGLSNACGAVAGAEIVGLYDRYYSKLIPDWASYNTSTGNYSPQDATYVPALMRELYNLMQINVNAAGVTESGFKTGLQQYITNHGYSTYYQSAYDGDTLNYFLCQSAVDVNRPIVLFTRAGNVYTISTNGTKDTISTYNITANHIMVAYGYMQIEYYNIFGLFRTDTYLEVATGLFNPAIAYYKINSTNLDAAYVVNVL